MIGHQEFEITQIDDDVMTLDRVRDPDLSETAQAHKVVQRLTPNAPQQPLDVIAEMAGFYY